MALADVFHEVRNLLHGQGLGEKPALVIGAADAGEVLSAPEVTFSLRTNQGDKVSAGDVLAAVAPASADAHIIYVTSVATDAVTGVDGSNLYGSPAVAASDLDNVVFEVDPLITSHDIHNAITTIVERHLWPDVYNVETKTVANPNLVDNQEAVDADVMEIISAWQVIGAENIPIACDRRPQTVNASQKSTGKLATFDWFNGSTGYYTAKTKSVLADDDGTPELTRLIATGAAALALGGTIVEATLENTKKDNADAVSQRSQAGGLLWRDFLTLKAEYARELGREHESSIVIIRG